MRRDHRPYYIKTLYRRFERSYARHFIKPQFESLGPGFTFMKPWHLNVFGAPIHVGRYATFIAAADRNIHLAVWPQHRDRGAIHIGSYCLLCPGVRIGSADKVVIEDNCMLASNVYITDSDWHGHYDRISSGNTAAVIVGNNAWIGDSAIVCKGVSIGENAIIGAGSVVVDDIPANRIAAGNPAKVVKRLDPGQGMITRAQWFANPQALFSDFDHFDRQTLSGNSLLHWLRHLVFPSRAD